MFGHGKKTAVFLPVLLLAAVMLISCGKKDIDPLADKNIHWENDEFGWKLDEAGILNLYSRTQTVVLPDTGFKMKNKYSDKPETTLPWEKSRDKIREINVYEGLNVKLNSNSAGLFMGMNKLESLNLSSFDTSECENMSWMFSGCSGLKILDILSFDTSSVTDMNHMFSGCQKLETVELSGFNTGKVNDMSHMFESADMKWCANGLKFDTSKVTDMSFMFYSAEFLRPDALATFDTSNVTNMEGMFSAYGFVCGNDPAYGKLDISNFNTQNVTNFNMMFASCGLTEIDMTGFDFSAAEKADAMFGDCKNLREVKVETVDFSSLSEPFMKDYIFLNTENVSAETLVKFGIA